MIISYALYELKMKLGSCLANSSYAKREGALLKVEFKPHLIGYADCHAWPELGDFPLQTQLNYLAQGRVTPLTRAALDFAFFDAETRFERKNIVELLNVPESHFLVTDIFELTPQVLEQIIQQGFTHIKLKMGHQLDREIECLHNLFPNTSIKLRLDFNEKLNVESFRQFLNRIENIRSRIDFIEDPFPFDAGEWTSIQKSGWTLACDRQILKGINQVEAARVLIIKPAVQSQEIWQQEINQTCIVTSYLGHPIGQASAAYAASLVDPFCVQVHGLLSHQAYQPTNFSKHLNWIGPSFIAPPGIGFGFDHELEKCNWILLKEYNQ